MAILTNLAELSIHKAWTLFCANTVSCLIMVAKVVSLKKDSPRGLKLACNRLIEHFKGFCSNEVESKGAQNNKKRKRKPKGYQNHLENRIKALNFVRRMEGSLYTADLLMQKDRQEKLERITKVLDSVIDTIYTLGSQNMPLRGHRDDSKYYDDKGNNPGNFQVMLEYRARSGDTVLAEHLKRTKENNGGRNCTYRSKTIQNEVIKCFEQERHYN